MNPSEIKKHTGVTWTGVAIAAAGLIALPFVLEKGFSEYHLYLAIKIMVWALFATSFNLVLGYGGMMSFGHAAFFGIGAYTCALLLVKAGCPVVLAFAAAPLGAAMAGLIIGFFSVRIKGVFYFATITLCFAQLAFIIVFKWRSFTYGDDGIQGIPVPALISTDITYIRYYFFALVVILACYFFLWRIVRSPFGMMLRSVKENPERAEFVGIKVERYRLIAFVISAFFSGIAGVLYAFMETAIAPDILFWSISGEVILMGLLGGMSLFFGPTVGAAIMVLLNTYITSYTEYWGLVLGGVLILIVLFFPKGVGGLVVEQVERRRKRRVA
jgi:branched-chain amino acid transport system permease protein